MTYFILTLILFLALLLLPLIWAGYWYFHSKESVLPVRQQRTRDPRYFAKSFDSKFREAWENREDGELKLSKNEEYFLTDGQQLVGRQELADKILVAQKEELVLPKNPRFEGEIYSDQNVTVCPDAVLRAVRTKGNLLLGKCSFLDRWADADGTIAVYEDCDAGISLTAGKAITIGENCSFRRLYAPVIHLGAYPGDNTSPVITRDERIYGNEIGIERLAKNKRRINSSQLEDDSGMVEACIVTDTKITIEENIVVMGDIHTRRSIHLAAGSVVCGNIFAGKHVYLDKNTTVLGSVFSQGNVTMDEGVVVGQEGRICSVIARSKIKTGTDCFVYGYISNEGGGVACPVNKNDRDNQKRPAHEEIYLTWPEPDPVLTFASADIFEAVDTQGYRHTDTLKKVIVPEGVIRIPDSMFFDCRNLTDLQLPVSLREIGKYAFADCKSLVRVDLSNLPSLRKLDLSAFDGCTGLKEVILPSGILVLGPAAFYGCTALERIVVPQNAWIREIGSHCFMHCPAKELPTVRVGQKSAQNKPKAPVNPQNKPETKEEGALTGG